MQGAEGVFVGLPMTKTSSMTGGDDEFARWMQKRGSTPDILREILLSSLTALLEDLDLEASAATTSTARTCCRQNDLS
jgi:hypothetical protein